MSSLTTLPLSIQSRILSYLCPHEVLHPRNSRWKPPFLLSFRDPSVTISLACAETLSVLLPGELLSSAQASPILAAAAANLLGSRVSYLTTWNTGDRLAEWATTFAPYVKAVSTWDPFSMGSFDDWNHGLFTDYHDSHFLMLERQMQRSMPVFKALSIDAVTLEVLDLTDIPFSVLEDMEDEVFGGLCTTLESNSATLRELALPVFYKSEITEKALEMSTLKKLDVLTVKLCCFSLSDMSLEGENPFVRMIKALDGHADRNRKLSTLSELRLWNANFLPFEEDLTHLDNDAGVFHAIKTLRVASGATFGMFSRLDVPFVFLFKKLERLFWSGIQHLNEMHLEKLCTTLSEFHICNNGWITSVHVGGREHHIREGTITRQPFRCYTEFCFTENHTLRAIRTLGVGDMNRGKVRRLIRSCPNLEFLSLTVAIENTASLTRLLSKCEHIEGLELLISMKGMSRFGHFMLSEAPLNGTAEGWRSLARVIPESHKNLRQLAVRTASFFHATPVKCVETMVDCFEKMVRTVGARARTISFRVKVKPRRNAMVLEQLCRLLKVFIQCTPALESLELDFPIDRGKPKVGGWNWDDRLVGSLFHLRNRLLRNVPSLRMLDLGVWHGLSKPFDRDDDRLKIAPVPIRSRRESDGS